MATPVGTVRELWRYPVKSMQGEELGSCQVTRLGVSGDRAYGVRDLGSGKVASAKQPRPWSRLLGCEAMLGSHGDPDDGVTVRLPDGATVRHGDDDTDRRLSALVGRDVRLEPATVDEVTYESWWPELDGLALSDVTADLPMAMSTEKGTYVDVAAVHILTTTALAHLQSLVPDSTIAPRRFRPNLVVETPDTEGWVENGWAGRTLHLGEEVRIALSDPAPRCVMTTLSQPGLPADRDILSATATHNRRDFAGLGDFACLGIYGEVETAGEVAVGQPVAID